MAPNSHSLNWVFTLNNYDDNDIERLASLSDKVQYLVYGKEVGESGTPHLQGFVRFRTRCRFGRCKNLIGITAHIEVAKDPLAAIEYCKKDNDITEIGSLDVQPGRRTDLDEFKDDVKAGVVDPKELREKHSEVFAKYRSFCMSYIIDNAPKKIMPEHVLNDWQREMKEYLETTPDQRKIRFVVDYKGNTGKSWFSYWYAQQNEKCQVLCPGKYADMAFVLRMNINVLILDCPRSKQGDFIQYDFLEHCKNGHVFSPKYESVVKQLDDIHIVVMMNQMPDVSKLSADRFQIIELNPPLILPNDA